MLWQSFASSSYETQPWAITPDLFIEKAGIELMIYATQFEKIEFFSSEF